MSASTIEVERPLWDEIMTHTGEWVAATATEIVAFGPDAAEVLDRAAAKGVTEPLLFQVPADPSVSFLL